MKARYGANSIRKVDPGKLALLGNFVSCGARPYRARITSRFPALG